MAKNTKTTTAAEQNYQNHHYNQSCDHRLLEGIVLQLKLLPISQRERIKRKRGCSECGRWIDLFLPGNRLPYVRNSGPVELLIDKPQTPDDNAHAAASTRNRRSKYKNPMTDNTV